MNRLTKVSIALTTVWAFGAQLSWASGPGTTSADFLKVGIGARAIAMGEAYTAQADDVSALYWNPAGLAWMQQRQASFMYSDYFRDVSFQNASLGLPLENGAIAGSVSYLNYGKIEGFDLNGNATGDQKAYDAVGTVGGAYLGNGWALGASVKGIQESLITDKANTFAVDLGGSVIYPQPVLGGTLRLAAVAKNLGQGLKYFDDRQPLPTEYRVGLAAVQMMNKRLNLSLDYGKPRDDKGGVYGGAEFWLHPMLALRAGYTANHTEGNGMRAGLGLRIKGISFDYAYSNYGDLGMAHRYELSLKFGEPRPILTAEEARILRQAKAAIRQGRYDQAVLLLDSLVEMEPKYKKARRLMNVAMANMEDQQRQMLARQGKTYEPSVAERKKNQALPDLDDLEALLSISQPKAAQAPKDKAAVNGTDEVK